jgi:ABC-2 type transport system ATP-binding protein
MEYAVEVAGLRKRFGSGKREFWALKGIDLRIRKGEIFGLLGPNGAGKTTTIYVLNTLLLPTSGKALVMGKDVVSQASEVRRRIGLCLGGTWFYGDLNPRENLEYYGRLMGLDRETRKRNIEWLIEALDITPFQRKDFADLSTGMKQKVAIAKSLLNDPDVLFLDEPTAGLDVEVAEDIREFIRCIVDERGMTVILTSHQLYEVEEMCDRIAVIDEGRVVAEGTVPEIRKRMGFPDVIHLSLDRHRGLGFLKGIPGVLDVEADDGVWIDATSAAAVLGRMLPLLKRRGYRVLDVEVRKADLKDMFLKLVNGKRGRRAGKAGEEGRADDAGKKAGGRDGHVE